MHVLFICSMNRWRSPTAEAVFRREKGINVRSAGTSSRAKRTVSVKDLRWADIILVMEQKHKTRLQAQFRDEVRYKDLHVLDIPDDYRYMDQDLIDLLRSKVNPLL
ncbi:MAG: protein tyrosine phosphatase [Pseudomonadota bacterium]